MVWIGRNEIHRSYPTLSYRFYPGLLAIMIPKQGYHSCAVRMKTILVINKEVLDAVPEPGRSRGPKDIPSIEQDPRSC